MDFQDAVTYYICSLKKRERSPKTCKNHEQTLLSYNQCLAKAQLDWREVTEQQFADYMAAFAESHSAAHTRIHRCTLTAFYSLAVKSEWVKRSPIVARVAQRPSRIVKLPPARGIPGVDPLFVQAIDAFYKNIVARRLSERTARQYEYLLVQYGRYLYKRRLAYTAVETTDIDEFLLEYGAERKRPARPGSRYSSTRSATTIALMKNSLRSFYHWAAHSKRIASSPAAFLERAHRDKPVRRAVKEHIVLNLLDKLNHPPEHLDALAHRRWQRNRLAILVFLFTGMRLSECASLTWEKVDLDGAMATIVRKGGNEQDVPLHPALVAELRTYKGSAIKGYLFRSWRGGALGASGISEMFRVFVQGELGITCTAHQLRHTFATTLLRHGADLLAIQKLLGHASVKTTEIYAEIADEGPAHALRLLPSTWSPPPADTPAAAEPVSSQSADESGPPSTQLSWGGFNFLVGTRCKAA